MNAPPTAGTQPSPRPPTPSLYRQGRVFERYREGQRSLVLAESLAVFRGRELLRAVLDEMVRDVGPKHVTHLKKLLKRPGLDPSSKKRAQRLIRRAKAGADRARAALP